jgi:type I restriction enzyme S subunit
MSTPWHTVALSEVVLLQRGHDLPSSDRNAGDVPIIGSFGVTGTHDTALYEGPGVAIGRSGAAIGTATYVDSQYWPLNTCLFVRDFKGNHPRWIYYLLDSIDFTAFNSGSAQPSLNRNFLRDFPVPLPPLPEQQAIADILGTLDDKIAANRILLDKVDELARTAWTLAREGGPETPLSSLARFVNGKAFTKNASGTGRIVIRIAELNSGIGSSTVYNDIDVPEDHLAQPGDLLFAWSGSLTVVRWFREEAIVNQHIFKVIPVDHYPIWLVDQALRDKLHQFKGIAADKATTMGHIQRRHLDEPVSVPTQDRIDEFDGLMSALWVRALAAEQENLYLKSTRDQLLPLLMSGKVRVQDAKKVVEGAV